MLFRTSMKEGAISIPFYSEIREMNTAIAVDSAAEADRLWKLYLHAAQRKHVGLRSRGRAFGNFERIDQIGDAFGSQRRHAIGDVKMQVRFGAVAGVAHQPQNLA